MKKCAFKNELPNIESLLFTVLHDDYQKKINALQQKVIEITAENKNLRHKQETVEDTLKHIIAHMPGHVYWKDKQGIYLGCNNRQAISLGFQSGEDLLGKSDFDLPWGDDIAKLFRANDVRIMSTGQAEVIEESTKIDGKEAIVLSQKTPIENKKGEIIGVLGISMDITARKKLEAELIQAKELAEAATRAKTAFIANISHDIRTPLSGVCGLSEILELALQDPEQKEDAHLLHESGEELLNMLNDILDDIKADKSSELDIQKEIFNLHHCIQNLIKLERPTTTVKQLALNYHIDVNVPPYIISDRKKIHRILLNLVGNAIKFTQSGQISINVTCLERSQSHIHLQFSVADTGIGIPNELQSKVFDRFFRVDPSYNGVYKGYGLGLHIVHAYVSLLGGHITLSSQENVGTTFYFDLNCDISKEQKATFPSYLETIDKQSSPSLSSTTPAENKDIPHILLIEDSPIALRVLQATVSNASCRFTSAMNGIDAFELIKSIPFDFVITDIGLPDISGTQLTQRIREWEKAQNKSPMPIIGLTGHAKETAMPDCLNSGMNDVFSKPITTNMQKFPLLVPASL